MSLLIKKIKPKKNIIIYMIFVFLSSLNFMSYFLSVYLLDKGNLLKTISVCFFVYQFSKFIFEIPTGFISDIYSRKLSSLMGLILLIISYIFLISNNTIVIYVSFLLRGLSITFISGSIESLFVESVEHKELIKYNVIERLIFYSALAISAGLGGFLIQYFGYNFTIILDSIILILTFLLVFQMDENISNRLHNKKKYVVNIKDVFKNIADNKIITTCLLIDFANAFSFVAVEDFYSAFLKGFNLESRWIGIIMAIQFVISASFGFFTKKISVYFSKEKILYIFPVIRSVITILIYINIFPLIFVPVIFLFQLILFAIYAPIKYQLFQKSIDSKIRATTLSLQSLMISLGSMFFYGFSSILGSMISIEYMLIIALMGTSIMLIIASNILKKQDIRI